MCQVRIMTLNGKNMVEFTALGTSYMTNKY